MAENFDPYYKWLGIPPKDQPPHHYRLLGIELFEPDRDVIDAAANRLMGYLKELASGDDAAHSQKLLNEISRARLCLLNKEKKAAYDRELKATLKPEVGKPVAQPPEAAQASQPTPPAFPSHADLHPAMARPQVEIGPVASRVDTRSKPPPLKSRGSAMPDIHEETDQTRDNQSGDESGRPVGTRRSFKKVLSLAATAVATLAGLAVVTAILLQPAHVDETSKKIARGKTAPSVPTGFGVLTLELTDEARRQVKAFLIDDQPQALPPPAEVSLLEGRHTITFRRDGYREVSDRFTLVKDVRRKFTPRWVPEAAKAPPSAEPAAAIPAVPPFQPETKPLPEMAKEKPVTGTMPSAGQTPPPPEPAAPSSPPPATDAEIQAAAAHGFSSGYGQMVAAWLLNGDGVDQSGHRHNGLAMMTGGSPTYVEGRVGSGLRMTPEVRFEVGEPIFKDASEFSVTLWVNLASLPATAEPLLNGETTAIFVQGGFPRVEIGGRKPLVGPETDPATGGFRRIELSTCLGTWVHLGFVYAARLRQVHYYLNGEHRGCQQFADAVPATWNRTIVTGWSGIWDETRIFNYRLSSGDVKAVLDGTFQPPPLPPRQADGALVCETWYDVPSASSRADVEDLLRRKPDAASTVETSLSCLAPAGAGDRLDRIQGFLFPPLAGDYSFQLQGSGRAMLHLQSQGPLQDTLPEIIVSQADQAATTPRIALDAGKAYYFEILHFYKGDAGGSLRLGWRLPGSPDRLEAIPAAQFGSYRGLASLPTPKKEAAPPRP